MIENFVQLSVIIPAFNASSTIARLLEHLQHQNISPASYEVIVIDDGSADETPSIVGRFPDVQFFNQVHAGPGTARMTGVRQAKGDFFLFLDSDLDVSGDLLKRHLDFHLENPAVDATGGSVLPVGNPPLFSWALADYFSTWFNAHPGTVYSKPPEYLPSLNFCVKRRVFENSQIKWDAGFKHTGEDVLFCRAMRLSGMKLVFLPQAVVMHQDRSTLKDYWLHMYRYGHHAPFVRGEFADLEYNFLFQKNLLALILTLPIIILGYTFLIWFAWRRTKLVAVTLMLPLILLGRLAYACGVVSGTLAQNKKVKDTAVNH